MEENERVKADKTLFKVNGGQIQKERTNGRRDEWSFCMAQFAERWKQSLVFINLFAPLLLTEKIQTISLWVKNQCQQNVTVFYKDLSMLAIIIIFKAVETPERFSSLFLAPWRILISTETKGSYQATAWQKVSSPVQFLVLSVNLRASHFRFQTLKKLEPVQIRPSSQVCSVE